MSYLNHSRLCRNALLLFSAKEAVIHVMCSEIAQLSRWSIRNLFFWLDVHLPVNFWQNLTSGARGGITGQENLIFGLSLISWKQRVTRYRVLPFSPLVERLLPRTFGSKLWALISRVVTLGKCPPTLSPVPRLFIHFQTNRFHTFKC